jgi:serine/threonine protein phosphatase PrpC
MKFTIYQSSRQGPRARNQDRAAYSYSKDALLTVLADGMGGHSHGEVAAQLAVNVLTESFQRMALPVLTNPFKFLSEHIRQVHDAIDRHALLNDMPAAPCTTIVATIVQHDTLYCAHAGDSRLYHFRNGKLLFRTEDHSHVQMLAHQGLISEEQMVSHPERNKIYNCIGGEIPPQIELAQKRAIQEGDVILLCTDGLWSLLEEGEMAEVLQNGMVTDTMPVLFGLAEARTDKTGDNMSAIAFNWEGLKYNPRAISTASMPFDINTTIHDRQLQRESGAGNQEYMEIEKAIAEIRAALGKISK